MEPGEGRDFSRSSALFFCVREGQTAVLEMKVIFKIIIKTEEKKYQNN